MSPSFKVSKDKSDQSDVDIFISSLANLFFFGLICFVLLVGVPASAGKAKAGMVHSVSGCTRGVQVKL